MPAVVALLISISTKFRSLLSNFHALTIVGWPIAITCNAKWCRVNESSVWLLEVWTSTMIRKKKNKLTLLSTVDAIFWCLDVLDDAMDRLKWRQIILGVFYIVSCLDHVCFLWPWISVLYYCFSFEKLAAFDRWWILWFPIQIQLNASVWHQGIVICFISFSVRS